MSGAVRYLAEVYGGDGARSLCLGGTVAPTQGLALRWLRGQALRIADGLDPGPDSAWAPPGTLWPVPQADLDAPTQLRSWAANVGVQEAASRRLADGVPYGFLARDASGWYRLHARPVRVPGTPSLPEELDRADRARRRPRGTPGPRRR
ncbi:hypothetical protein C0Q64_12420 [Streptomyces albidoflavus]|uniref:hypothetical protein n=1 Tax=Streptomyces albidoflavus TaxID=1886 RepID=UPI00101E837D|nr:hypothetical protein [Streptomyces albidoflavus]RZE02192.1 hypothetical protein C0Q64_12420 [Streptomyces albidoflavus]RZE03053.1 hypothetical protein C0Q65_12745 [Streptomyces albidoflavus]